MAIDYLQRILTARVYDVAIESPLEPAPLLSARLGNRLLLKREDLQPVFSFKLRGAYNKMVRLSPAERERGVVTASAGNHAQGVALAAARLGCPALIVMPNTTPRIKIAAVAARGARIVLHGDAFSDAYDHARHLEQAQGLTFVHPYDDPDVIAGQGTIGMEILRQHPDPIHAVFCAVGGGGLIAGVGSYLKRLRPDTRLIGVEAADAAAMTASLAAGERVALASVGLFADGAAVRQVGVETFRLCQAHVDAMITVDTDAICAAIKDVFEDTRTILEPAGALAIAGAKQYLRQYPQQAATLVAVASGANMNFDRLRFVAERAEVGEQREAVLAVTLPERPGAYKQFMALVGARSITEFNYRYSDADAAHVFVGVETGDRGETRALIGQLQAHGYPVLDLSDDELAKSHLRHLVGGRSAAATDERLIRFEFPERPGALAEFLQSMTHDWNISLFHYRNHGADYGSVLVGVQVPGGDRAAFDAWLCGRSYAHIEETANPAYRLFLG